MTTLRLLHFNDIYKLLPRKKEPVGGAARFGSKLEEIKQKNPDNHFVLFSGDAFNPSTESSITKGAHMVPVLNELGIDAAVYGNHDFDFGTPQLTKLSKATAFPWLSTNLVDKNTDQPVAAGKKWQIVEKCGVKIGFIGIVEKEWLQTIAGLPPYFLHKDMIETAKETAAVLRAEPYNVDLVIALTHCRLPNDILLSKGTYPDVDFILGGHDHFYYVGKACQVLGGWDRDSAHVQGDAGDEGCMLVKSGTDFKELSEIEFEVVRQNGNAQMKNVKVTRHEVTSDVPENPHLAEVVKDATASVTAFMSKPIGWTETPLDARASTVRSKESSLGNLAADLMLNCYPNHNVDCALLCGGTIRSDTLYTPGKITIGDIMDSFPFEDPIVVIRVTGKQIWDALESGLSAVPKSEGRFPHVSGLRIEYCPKREPGKRIIQVWHVRDSRSLSPALDRSTNPLDNYFNDDENDTMIEESPLDLEREYNLCTRGYMAKGYDGYAPLKDHKCIIDDENGIIISTLFRRFFLGLTYVNAILAPPQDVAHTILRAAQKFKQSIKKQNTRYIHNAMVNCDNEGQAEKEDELANEEEQKEEMLKEWASVAPEVEGRITEVDE